MLAKIRNLEVQDILLGKAWPCRSTEAHLYSVSVFPLLGDHAAYMLHIEQA